VIDYYVSCSAVIGGWPHTYQFYSALVRYNDVGVCVRQVNESTTIETTAKQALNTSNEAYRIAQEAVQQPGETASEIDIILRR